MANTESWYLLKSKIHHFLAVKKEGEFCVNSHFLTNIFITINNVSHNKDGFLIESNKYDQFLAENLIASIGKLQELILFKIEKSCSFLKKITSTFLTITVLTVMYTGNYKDSFV